MNTPNTPLPDVVRTPERVAYVYIPVANQPVIQVKIDLDQIAYGLLPRLLRSPKGTATALQEAVRVHISEPDGKREDLYENWKYMAVEQLDDAGMVRTMAGLLRLCRNRPEQRFEYENGCRALARHVGCSDWTKLPVDRLAGF